MQELGQFLLLVTFFVTLSTALLAIVGAVTRHGEMMRASRYGLYASAALYVAMALILSHGFLTHDFSNKYIASYSDRSMPTLYLMAAFWGGEKGALLLWTTALSIFGSIAIHTRREREPTYLSWAIATLALAIVFFDVLMVFESNPFETFVTSAGPMDGKGLNPLLQNPTMAFHPPTLLTGYIAFTIPFAFGVAALITGKLDNQWITDSRTWTIISWCFLSIGLVLGALWAYEELGWGFYWMWDPVENAGFIPWLTATAYLHSVMIQERRGMLRRWNVILVCLTFFLTIFGTFLTRSQLIDSIHSFADSTLAQYFLWYMFVLIILSVCLISWRWKALRSEHDIEALWSRESMFVMNNVFLVGCAFIVMWGTLFPKVSELETVQAGYNGVVGLWNASLGSWTGQPMETMDQAVSLAEPWFNSVITPIGLGLLVLMGIGPLVPWRRATIRMLKKNFLSPVIGAILGAILVGFLATWSGVSRTMRVQELSLGDAIPTWFATLELAHVYMMLAYLFCIFVTWTIVRELVRSTRIRARKIGASFGPAAISLVFKSPRRYGGYVIHLGIVLMFVAFTGKVFKTQDPERPMRLGDTVSAGPYHLTYTSAEAAWRDGEGYASTRATITVLDEDETVHSREVDALTDWLDRRGVGAYHVSTEFGSPKVRVHIKDRVQRDRLRDDLYLAKHFTSDFVKVADDPENATQTWRLSDTGLIRAVPRMAMQRARTARTSLGPGTTFGTSVKLTPGSAQILVSFDDEAAMTGFDNRIADLDVPADVLYGAYSAETGALEFIDRRTGTLLSPEVRFFPKHETPTTETAIVSTLFEDLYLAMRPAMGQNFINLLTVVFPLVSFLWMGAVILLFGTLICLTPPWFARTMIGLVRPRARRLPAGAVASTAVTTLLLLVALPVAHGALPQPRGMAPPPPGQELPDIYATLTCACPGFGEVALTLADARCTCREALDERILVERLLRDEPRDEVTSGRAKLDVLERLVSLDPGWDARLIYDVPTYEHLVTTTKTVCPGERGLVLSQAQISCSIRNRWFPRFRAMFASGMSTHAIFRYYVDDSNVTMAPSQPWTYEDLKANPEKALSWAFPGALVLGLVGLLFAGITRRRKAGPFQPAIASSSADHLTPEQRLLLEDELDAMGG
jgi:cytochrome c-type biogenesis protein CcmF